MGVVTLEDLRPTTRQRVIDLVAQAGVDVAPWAFRADGTPVAVPAANPAYCYEWYFGDATKVVLSLWFDRMKLENGRVVQRFNMRDLRRRIEKAPHLDSARKKTTVRRAVAVDSAVQRAFRDKLPVRVIVCEGDIRSIDDLANRDPSKVERRLLDSSSWHVLEYDYLGTTTGGAAVIVRDELLA
jgi:hypothetical protein